MLSSSIFIGARLGQNVTALCKHPQRYEPDLANDETNFRLAGRIRRITMIVVHSWRLMLPHLRPVPPHLPAMPPHYACQQWSHLSLFVVRRGSRAELGIIEQIDSRMQASGKAY
jgi:hypothetical protein